MCSKMDYVPTLTRLFSPSLFFFPSFLPFLPLYCFHSPSFSQVSFSAFNGLHMSAKWPWHRCDKVKCLSAPSHAVPPRVRSQCSAYSTQPQPSVNPPVQTTTISIPIHLSLCQLFVIAACYQREKTDTLGV